MTTPIALRPYGPDLSSHNSQPHVAHDPDFDALKAGGASFVFIKRGQGASYLFDKYNAQVLRAAHAGLIVLDYWYLSYNALPADQVKRYLATRHVATRGAFDFENWSDSGEGPRRGHDYMQTWGHDFIIQYHAAFGHYPILYNYPSFWVDTLHDPAGEPFISCPLWEADYRNPNTGPEKIGGWPFASFWQYTSVGTLPGVSGVVDINRFNGTIEQLKTLVEV